MGKVIRCDFRRTERRNKMDRILEDTYYIADIEKQKNPYITEDELFSLPRVQRLNKMYAELIMEENEWGGCEHYR